MPISKTWPSGGTNPTPTTYQIPLNTELNWTTLTTFLQALADSAQGTSFQKFALRRAVASPVAIVATTDCVVVTDLTVAGAVTVNLPAGADKQLYFIFDGKGDAATNNITINRAGADTIRGATSLVIDRNYGGVILAYNAASTDWKAFGPFITPGGVLPADFVGILPTTKGGTGVNGTATFPGSGTVAIYPISLTTDVSGILPVANGGTGISSLGAGVATFLGTPSSANLASTVTDETGSGALVFGTSPTITTATLVTPALGTPASGVMTNVTGLPLTTGVTGILPEANGGTGIAALGAGVATWLGTPSSANLASAMTDETGTGSLVFANSPTFITPNLGTPASGVATNLTGLPLTTGVTGTLPILNGGTGSTTATTAFDALAPTTTKGDLIASDGTDNIRLAVGSNGTVLTADSAQASGLTWTTPLTNPMTTQGDIIYGGVGGAANRLPAGTSGQVLRTNGVAAPTWTSVGLLPIGSVIATFPHLTGAYSTVATTTPDANGFVLCQGQTLASGAMSGQVVPNISNSVFLRGATVSANTIQSSASRTLVAGNIPSLTSTGTTTTTGTTVANTTGTQSVDHSHTYSGTTSGVSANHNHGYNQDQFIKDGAPGSDRFTMSSQPFLGTGLQSADHTHTYSGTTSGISANHTHSIPSLTVNSGMGVSVSYSNAATSFNIEPTYIDAVYLMRAN